MIAVSHIKGLHPNIIFRVNTNLLYCPLKKIIRFILTVAFSIICSHLLAQQNVSGVVLDDDNIPLAGATGNISGSNKLTLTSVDDIFSINTSTGDKKGNIDEVKAIANDLITNEQKINHHGKRADAIVKGMLQHSRVTSGQMEPTNINILSG